MTGSQVHGLSPLGRPPDQDSVYPYTDIRAWFGMEAREQPDLKKRRGCHRIGVGAIRQHRVEVTNNSGPQHGA